MCILGVGRNEFVNMQDQRSGNVIVIVMFSVESGS